ncbi:MAG: DUF4928 domain-containing protein, partial [Gemmataceae bacterium]|nr:DUF4928 domain-containing protein [Gemmataceae bacterium]
SVEINFILTTQFDILQARAVAQRVVSQVEHMVGFVVRQMNREQVQLVVDDLGARRIAVESIESFVATNIDELAEFDGTKLVSGFRRLLERYNERANAAELDKSILIEMPRNLE